jgi:hypothetical protein
MTAEGTTVIPSWDDVADGAPMMRRFAMWRAACERGGQSAAACQGDSMARPSVKDKADALIALGNAHWRDFDTRRSYEWRTSFALWTALRALAALMAKGDAVIIPAVAVCIGLIVLAVFLVYWLFWMTGMWRRNEDDLFYAYESWNAARVLLGLTVYRNPERKQSSDKKRLARFLKDSRTVWKNWSRGSQLLVTLMFSCAAWAAILAPLFFSRPPACLY